RIIAGTFEDFSKEARAGRWWNRVFRFLKDKAKQLLGIESIENAVIEYNPFSEAAQMILSERTLSEEMRVSLDTSNDYFYSINTELQDRIVNEVKNKHKVTSKGSGE